MVAPDLGRGSTNRPNGVTPEIGRDRRTHLDTHDEPPVVIPRIGEQVGDVMQADCPGCYHLITAKQPTPISDTGYVTIFDSYPTWQMVGGRLMPMSQEEAQQAYLRWSAGAPLDDIEQSEG